MAKLERSNGELYPSVAFCSSARNGCTAGGGEVHLSHLDRHHRR